MRGRVRRPAVSAMARRRRTPISAWFRTTRLTTSEDASAGPPRAGIVTLGQQTPPRARAEARRRSADARRAGGGGPSSGVDGAARHRLNVAVRPMLPAWHDSRDPPGRASGRPPARAQRDGGRREVPRDVRAALRRHVAREDRVSVPGDLQRRRGIVQPRIQARMVRPDLGPPRVPGANAPVPAPSSRGHTRLTACARSLDHRDRAPPTDRPPPRAAAPPRRRRTRPAGRRARAAGAAARQPQRRDGRDLVAEVRRAAARAVAGALEDAPPSSPTWR